MFVWKTLYTSKYKQINIYNTACVCMENIVCIQHIYTACIHIYICPVTFYLFVFVTPLSACVKIVDVWLQYHI